MKLILSFSIFTFTIVFPQISGLSNDDADHEPKLRAAIAANLTSVYSHPLQSKNIITTAQIYMFISQVGLDEKTEILTVNGWLFHWWIDERIIWDPAKFGGLQRIGLSADSIWKPNAQLFNSASFVDRTKMFGTVPVIAFHDGYIHWHRPYSAQSICAVDLKLFPFDKYKCFLEFRAWLYSGKAVNITVTEYEEDENFLARYGNVHNEWELLKTTAENIGIALSDFNYNVAVHFNIHLRRRATYYHYCFILPTLIGIFLCLVIFWVPVNIKFIIGSFNIFLLTLFTVHVYWVVPRSGSSVPNIIVIISNTLALAGVSVLFSVITINLSRRSKPDLPEIIPNYLSGWLGVILCLRPPPVIPTVTAKISSPHSDSIQMRVSEQTNQKPMKIINAWVQLAVALDRLFFIVYCFTFFIIFMITLT